MTCLWSTKYQYIDWIFTHITKGQYGIHVIIFCNLATDISCGK